ncbi:Serine/threonine protein kinase [Spraguea lophii 42_110]|uniref:Serine/threonine protein kinase n=1 Tax=Spraguea lophii (strain 42_110) TaxID=1358809 RepID=S7WDV8_SPRLO|nr:Serine/threonine protein kinase [Spraguea lophii 42_110]
MNFILLMLILLKSHVSKILFIKIIKTASISICGVPKLHNNQNKKFFRNFFKKNSDQRKIMKKKKVICQKNDRKNSIKVTTNEEHTIVRRKENQAQKKSRSSIEDAVDIKNSKEVNKQLLENPNTVNNSEKLDIKKGSDKVLKKYDPVRDRTILLSTNQKDESAQDVYKPGETSDQLNVSDQQPEQDDIDLSALYLRVYDYFLRLSNQLHWNHIAFNRGCNTTCFPSHFTLFTKNLCYPPKLINQGATAQIFKIQLTCHKKCEYAMKVLDFSYLSSSRCHSKVFFNHDVYFMEYFKSVSSKYIIKGYAAYYYNKTLYLIYELFENTLFDYIEKNKRINYKNIIKISQNILHGINFLHKNNIVHSDIKPSNITIDADLNIRLFDFGYSFINSPSVNKKFAYGYTKAYYLTCVIYDKRPCFYDDFWAYGVILFALVERTLPFDEFIEYCKNEDIKITRELPDLVFSNKFVPEKFKMYIRILLDINFYDFVKFNSSDLFENIERFLKKEERILLKLSP